MTVLYFAEDLKVEDYPLLTDGNKASCQAILNEDPIRNNYTNLVLTKNCYTDAPVNVTFTYKDIGDCNFMQYDLVLHIRKSRNAGGCDSMTILYRCKLVRDRSEDNSCEVTCPCEGLQCDFVLVSRPKTNIQTCELELT